MEYKFKFNKNESEPHKNVYLSIKVVYNREEHSFDSINGGGGTVLLINDKSFGLDFDNESKRIGGFSDYLGSIDKLDEIDIATPKNFDEGILYLHSTSTFNSGMGYTFNMANELFYDKKTNNFQMGKWDSTKSSHRFLNNAYAQLDEKGTLTGIIITDVTQ